MALQSPLGNLFIAIQDRLVAQVAAIKWVDQNFGQLDNYQEGYKPPVNFPCALIDITGILFEDGPNGQQTASVRVVISLSTAPFSQSNNKTPISQKEKALEYYELEDLISAALHNWQPAGFDKLLRRSLDKAERDDSLRERILVFETSYTDTAAVPVKTIVARPDPVAGADVLLPS